MLGACRKLVLVAAVGIAVPVAGFAKNVPAACNSILSHMDASVRNGGPTMRRYCGRFANGGEYLVVAYSNQGGTYTAYTATQSDQKIEPSPATLNKDGVLVWHAVRAGMTRTVVFTYLLAPDHVLTRIARGTEGATITLKTDRLMRI